MKAGKSVDASKRRALQVDLPRDDLEEDEDRPRDPFTDDSGQEQVCVKDLIMELLGRLNSFDGLILKFLDEGDSPSQIARQLGVSHTSVANHRRHIMVVAAELGLVRAQ